MNTSDRRKWKFQSFALILGVGVVLTLGVLQFWAYLASLGWPSCRLSLEDRLHQRVNSKEFRHRFADLTQRRALDAQERKALLDGISLTDLDCKNFPNVVGGKDEFHGELEMKVERINGILFVHVNKK